MQPYPQGREASFEVTTSGIRAYVPLMKLDDNYVLANLFCKRYNADKSQEDPLYFILRRDFSDTSEEYPRYHVQAVSTPNTRGQLECSRLVTPNDHVARSIDLTRWENIYISAHPEYLFNPAPDSRNLMTRLLDTLSLHFIILPSNISHIEDHANLYLSSVAETPVPWTGLSPMTLRFVYSRIRSPGQISITIVRCSGNGSQCSATEEGSVFPSRPYYAFAEFYGVTSPVQDEARPANSHKCPEDHVTDGSTRIFCDMRFGQLTLSFSQSLVETPGETVQLRIDFEVSCFSFWDSQQL